MKRSRSPFGPFPKQETPRLRISRLEQEICQAIRERLRVELRYENDLMARLFSPEILFTTSQQKVCVAGIQVRNPNNISDPPDDPHNFEVGRITFLKLTDERFVPNRIDRSDVRYRNGIICP